MVYLIPLAAAALVGVILHLVFRTLDPAKINYAPCEGGYWEAELNGCKSGLKMIPQQPISSYTALTYVAGSMFVALQLLISPAYVFALASVYLCVATAVFHAVSSLRSHDFDKSSMYAACSTLTVYAACPFLGLAGWAAASLMLVVAVLAGYVLAFVFPGIYRIKVGAFVVAAYLLAFFRVLWGGYSAATPFLLVSLGLFAVGLVCQVTDRKRLFPIKRWGHGIWHLLTSVAIPMLFYAVHQTQ